MTTAAQTTWQRLWRDTYIDTDARTAARIACYMRDWHENPDEWGPVSEARPMVRLADKQAGGGG